MVSCCLPASPCLTAHLITRGTHVRKRVYQPGDFGYHGLLLASAAVPALADRDWSDDCHKRLETDRAELDRDLARHGERTMK